MEHQNKLEIHPRQFLAGGSGKSTLNQLVSAAATQNLLSNLGVSVCQCCKGTGETRETPCKSCGENDSHQPDV